MAVICVRFIIHQKALFMKAIFTFIFLITINAIAYFKQETVADISVCTIANSLCNTDLTNPISGMVLDSVDNISYGKSGVSTDVLYRKNRCDGLTNTPDSCKDGLASLNYKVYYPSKLNNKNLDYSECGLPVIIMFHGGSFDECSDRQNPGIVYICRELAKRGFIVFNVEYRRGVLIDTRKPYAGYKYKYVSAQQILAIYRASQDVRGAVRTIIYKQRTNGNDAAYKIDTNKLFLGGISAGSLAV